MCRITSFLTDHVFRSDQYAQDIFTVQGSYLEGRPPTSVNMYWRRFRIDSIPLNDPKTFDKWLRARWEEKDNLLGIYYRTGRFPADSGAEKGVDGKVRRGAGHIESEVKSVRWYEFLRIFAPVGLFAMVLYMFYGAVPKQVVASPDKQLSGDALNTVPKAWTRKSWGTANSFPRASTSKVTADNSAVVTWKRSKPLSGKFPNNAKAENVSMSTRKPPTSQIDRNDPTYNSTATTRQTPSVLTKVGNKSKIGNSVAPTPKVFGSNSESSGRAKVEESEKKTERTSSSLPKSSNGAKAKKSISPIPKNKLEIRNSGPGKKNTRKENLILGDVTSRKNPVQAPTQAQARKTDAPEASRSSTNKLVTKNRPMKGFSSTQPSKALATDTTKKHEPQHIPKSTCTQPKVKSASTKLLSQKAKTRGAINSFSDLASPKKKNSKAEPS